LIGHVDVAGIIPVVSGQFGDFGVGEDDFLFSTDFLNHPKAHDVLQKADRPPHADFVGEPVLTGFFRDDGLRQCQSQKRPRSAGKERRIAIA